MRSVWHPVAGVAFAEPPVLANPAALRLLLAAGPVRLRCLGDSMWPALRHGQAIDCVRLDGTPDAGAVVVADTPGGLRAGRVSGRGPAALVADADPAPVAGARPLAVVVGARPGRARLRGARRVLLDLGEALAGLGAGDEAAAEATVRAKYDFQAPDYVLPDVAFDEGLVARVRRAAPGGGRLLVVGSGAGLECERLVREGFDVVGLDFAPRMVEIARERAAAAGLAIDYVAGDVHEHREAPRSLAAVLFTYDVYSFLAGRRRRVATLRRIRPWLLPGASVFVSARRCRGGYAAAVLTLEWLAAHGRARPVEWGDSHTRWLGERGSLRRSYVHYTTASGLRLEAAAAGYRVADGAGGHTRLRPEE